MTTEQKAKAYDESIGRAKEMIKAMTNIGGVAKVDDIQYLFPELKESESEDEEIRKDVLAFIRREGQHIDKYKWHKWIAWLEKQKEQKPITINQDEKEFLADEITAFLCNYDKEFDGEDPVPSEVAEHFYLLGKQAQEQKPAEDWREKRKKECPFRIADGCKQYAGVISECTGACSWVVDYPKLKEIQDKREQKSATWRGDDGMKPAKWSYPYGVNETVDRLFAIAECLEMDGDCLFNGYSGTECGKFLRELARKQVEYKPAEWSEEDKAIVTCIVCCLDGQFVTEAARKQCLEWFNKHRRDFLNQQKQEWSEEDKFKLEDAITGIDVGIGFYETEGKHPNLLKAIIEAKDWLKSLPERFNLQPKPEWSEEDEKMLRTIISDGSRGVELDSKQISWLKSLRSHLHWKPSEEQMKALSETIAFAPDTFKPKCTLVTLQDDLKKLMEE